MRSTFVALALLGAAGTSASEEKVGVVDVDRLLFSTRGLGPLGDELDAFSRLQLKPIQERAFFIEAKRAEYRELLYMVPVPQGRKEQLQKLVDEIETLERQLQEAAAEVERRIAQKEQEISAPIHARMQKAIDEVAAEGGYTYILRRDASLLYIQPDAYLDEAVAKKLGISLTVDWANP